LDLTLPDASGLDGLLDLRGVSSEATIVVVTADDDESRESAPYKLELRMTSSRDE
jgi:DNA-binding response OmpR family regulator